MAVPRRAAAPSPAEAESIRYAEEVSVAATRAAATAARTRAEWEAAQRDVDAAWEAFEAADQAARRATRAAAYPLMSRRRKPGENAVRQRYLHHAATAACRNREISIAQLNDVLAHRGWNPRLHPVVQEFHLRHAIRAHRLAEYRAAQDHERALWETAEKAADALRSLRAEATIALARAATRPQPADEHWFADQWSTGEVPATA
ncbi:hypothetical protein Ade02nite_45550 [Paractinoplanes deccanensis]|uniref:Uncharacterized protein n=2 Tax=Paractinoplanes deccanensis TaxID=113561 RepID=A0ABQ3Y7E0_9ACTN|nr:hypothetical protein Ade02nite_45550 [Actinoplanes deccanensis]